jgi:hypothetical protein
MPEDTIFLTATKRHRLDFIWLGVSGRLGTSIGEFAQCVQEVEDFKIAEACFSMAFLDHLNKELEVQWKGVSEEEYIEEVLRRLERCQVQASRELPKIEKNVIDAMCQRSSECILMGQLTSHKYFSLLRTRNYFKSIWIDESAVKRLKNFQSQIHKRELKNIEGWL